MKQAVLDAFDRLLLQMGLTREEFLWVLLGTSFLFATFHFLTMLLTRWGDRRATAKALIFSILIHACCGLGMFGVALNARPAIPAPTESAPIRIKNLITEEAEPLDATEEGNTPVWDRLPVPPEMEMTRADRDPFNVQPLDVPEREQTQMPRDEPVRDLPDVPALPQQSIEAPAPELPSQPAVRPQPAENQLALDAPQPEARMAPEVKSPSNPRTEITREGAIDTTVDRQPTRGAAERMAPSVDPERQLAAVEGPADPSAFLKRGPEAETARPRTAPAPAPLSEPEAGTPAPERTESPDGTAAALSGVTRERSRLTESRSGGASEPATTERMTRSAGPSSNDSLALRETIPLDIPGTGERLPTVERPGFPAVRDRKSTSVPSTYRLRDLAKRRDIARKFGGTDESERAVELSLKWLANNQSPEGFWDADRHGAGKVRVDEQGVDRQFAGKNADSGLTALALLAFLGAGYTHEDGQYAQNVDRAIRWLISKQTADGYLGADATHYEKMYCHGMATYALAEAYGMQSDPTTGAELREAIVKAVGYIRDHQYPDGGWRYSHPKNVSVAQGDMSMFGWQLMALKSAEIAGIPIPAEARTKMVQFLKDRSIGTRKGLAGYREDLPATPAMTAEALFCKQMLGISRTNPASMEAVAYLLQHIPKRSELNLYYWYYGTLAMYQYGGESWDRWNGSLRDTLIAEQITRGENAGSWDPRDPWGQYGGRIYSTALSTLCLEVYYRFLPLYQMGGFEE